MVGYTKLDSYCCIELLKAVRDGYLKEVISGVVFPIQEGDENRRNVPRLKYCPFCRAEIKNSHIDNSWDWWTEKDTSRE